MRKTTGRLIVLLSALALVLSLVAATTFSTLSPQETAVSVDLGATPKGWVPVDFGDAQVSVPPSWSYDLNCPGTSGLSMTLEQVPSSTEMLNTAPCEIGNYVVIAPYSSGSAGPSEVINGIHLYASEGEWVAPGLGVKVSVRGSLGLSILDTITHSPRAIVLASGPSPPVPTSWHRISFDGVSFEVPSAWPQIPVGGMPCGGPSMFGASEVIFSSGGISFGICTGPWDPVVQPDDGLLIQSVSSGAPTAELGPCVRINGISTCPGATSYGLLGFVVRLPGKNLPVVVELGLSGDGIVARTILYSMRVT